MSSDSRFMHWHSAEGPSKFVDMPRCCAQAAGEALDQAHAAAERRTMDALAAQRRWILAAVAADLDTYASAAEQMPMPAWRRHLVARIVRACGQRIAKVIETGAESAAATSGTPGTPPRTSGPPQPRRLTS